MAISLSPPLLKLSSWLAGVYSNREQALDQAVWFIPVQLWYLPLPHLFREGLGFFTEQINQHHPETYYRSRVLQLLDQPLRCENYRLRDQKRWAGYSQHPQRLVEMTPEDLILLPGCTIFVDDQGDHFQGQMSPESMCCLTPEADSTVEISWDLYPHLFSTLDRGFDRLTHTQVWGSKAGPYLYRKLSPATYES